jgi:hypothetical protein
MRTTGRDIGFPAPGTPSAFQPEPPVSLRSPSAPPFDDASSSLELSASSRVLRPATCPSCPTSLATDQSAEERLPWGSSSLIAASTSGVHHSAGIPTPRSSSALDVSHVLDGLLRHQPSRACFIPLPRPGFALQGIVPQRGAVRGFPRRVMPSCRWTSLPAVLPAPADPPPSSGPCSPR